jgi:hypothetical protein
LAAAERHRLSLVPFALVASPVLSSNCSDTANGGSEASLEECSSKSKVNLRSLVTPHPFGLVVSAECEVSAQDFDKFVDASKSKQKHQAETR